MTTEAAIDTAASAVELLTVELPEILAITGTVHAGMLDALAAVLDEAHVFGGLSGRDARRVAGMVAFEAIRSEWVMADAAEAITDRAIAVQLDRCCGCDDRMAVGFALHRAAAVLEADSEQL